MLFIVFCVHGSCKLQSPSPLVEFGLLKGCLELRAPVAPRHPNQNGPGGATQSTQHATSRQSLISSSWTLCRTTDKRDGRRSVPPKAEYVRRPRLRHTRPYKDDIPFELQLECRLRATATTPTTTQFRKRAPATPRRSKDRRPSASMSTGLHGPSPLPP